MLDTRRSRNPRREPQQEPDIDSTFDQETHLPMAVVSFMEMCRESAGLGHVLWRIVGALQLVYDT